MLSMIKIKQTVVKEMRMVQPLNLKPKSLNKILSIIQMHIFLQQVVMKILKLHLKIYVS